MNRSEHCLRSPQVSEYARARAKARQPPLPAEKRDRITRAKTSKMTPLELYDVLAPLYRSENPTCAYCGQTPENITVDHIVSGTGGKAASRNNIDTWNPACPECNCEHFTIEKKVLAKVRHVIRTIERKRRRKLSDEQRAYVLRELNK